MRRARTGAVFARALVPPKLAVIGATIAGLVGSVASAAPVGAANEQGSISFSATGTVGTFPCNNCSQLTFSNTATSGYVAGVSGSPFTLAWATPSAQLGIFLNTACDVSQIPSVVEIFNSPATLTISGAELVYGGIPSPASVTASFNLTQDPGATEMVANSLSLQVNASTGVNFSFTPGVAPQGLVLLTPAGLNGVCPATPGPITLDLSGTVWSVM